MATAVKEFSIEEKLIAVLSLQKIDSKIDELQTLRGELPIEVKDLEDNVAGLQTRINNIEEEIKSINDYITSRRDAKKDSEALIAKYEKQQDNVKNSREFEALEKEVEMQQLEMRLCDKNIKDSLVELQEREHKKIQNQSLIEAKQEMLNQKQSELERIISETDAEEKVLEKASIKAKEKVDNRLLDAYRRIRTNYKNGLAVVPVLRDSCGGCFNAIPPQRQTEIAQHKKIIACEHCGRVLVDSDLNDTVKI
ncbi:MAG TPA: C4-type zinc ribbon domain-containing protein [Edaphocola sp.]|nr:C4-type zinc ribbon domain-containing protein [Edaphocola sp.]